MSVLVEFDRFSLVDWAQIEEEKNKKRRVHFINYYPKKKGAQKWTPFEV